jgi:2-hydroxy-6-oxonona-2,4-dienedioate hydrolase
MGGATPSVLLLHGMFGKPENWHACAEHLSPRWMVMTPALPIFELPLDEVGVDALVEHVRSLLDSEAIDRAVIAGNSLGGHVALRLALRDPHRVAALVLTGSSGLMERGLDGAVPRRPSRDWLRVKIGEVFYDDSYVTDALIDEVHAIVCDPRRARHLLLMAKSAKRDNLRDVLPHVRCPVLLVWGADDIITPPEVAHKFCTGLPEAELRFINRCGHAPMMEQPDEFNLLVELFLDRLFSEAAVSDAVAPLR